MAALYRHGHVVEEITVETGTRYRLMADGKVLFKMDLQFSQRTWKISHIPWDRLLTMRKA